MDLIHINVKDRIALVRLCRPEKKNALTAAIFDERLSDDLLKSTREGTKARLGLSDAAPSGGTVQ